MRDSGRPHTKQSQKPSSTLVNVIHSISMTPEIKQDTQSKSQNQASGHGSVHCIKMNGIFKFRLEAQKLIDSSKQK